jgi:malonyl-CoA O-methyltransferase
LYLSGVSVHFTMINKTRIKKSFSSHARSYDQSAHLQQKVAREVVAHAGALEINPASILDIGTGTGYVALALKQLFPCAASQACDIAYGMVVVAKEKGEKLFGTHLDFISADAEYLPYRGEIFDLVVSSLAYQWLSDWKNGLREVLRVLPSGGVFLFATLGERTLCELRDSYLRSYRELGNRGTPHLHSFITRDALHTLLTEEGFAGVSVESKIEREYHNGVKELLVHLKTIGAQNASRFAPLGLGKPRVFGKMVDIYQTLYGDGLCVPATFELQFGFGRKA